TGLAEVCGSWVQFDPCASSPCQSEHSAQAQKRSGVFLGDEFSGIPCSAIEWLSDGGLPLGGEVPGREHDSIEFVGDAFKASDVPASGPDVDEFSQRFGFLHVQNATTGEIFCHVIEVVRPDEVQVGGISAFG